METVGSGETQHTADEVKQLKACIDDLIGFVSLPATWSGCEPSEIVSSLLDALLSVLRLDFAYARLRESIDMEHIEMFRVSLDPEMPRPSPKRSVRRSAAGGADGPQAWPSSRVPNPLGSGDVCVVPFRLGLQDEIGFIVAGRQRTDFPNETESLLLRVAANQASIVIRWYATGIDIDDRKRAEERVRSENLAREEVDRSSMFEEIVGSSEPLRRVLAQVAKVAPTDSTSTPCTKYARTPTPHAATLTSRSK